MFARRRQPSVWKGLAAGVAGGLVASWTMNQFQGVWSWASQELASEQNGHAKGGNGQTKGSEGGEDATQKVADKAAVTALDRHLTSDEKEKAGPAVHYAFGAVMGGIYGVASEFVPAARSGQGATFGTALFLGADELALPALNLSKSPAQYPLSKHAYGMASHFVYGLTTEWVRRAVRSGLGR